MKLAFENMTKSMIVLTFKENNFDSYDFRGLTAITVMSVIIVRNIVIQPLLL